MGAGLTARKQDDKDAVALPKDLVHSGGSMFAANNLEKALARYEKYGNGTTGEDENGEDFDPKKE